MAKGQKKLQQQNEQRSQQQFDAGKAAQDRLINSKEMADYKDRIAQKRKAIGSGTLADANDFLSNRSAVAERKAKYDAETNLAPTGIGALGLQYANPDQVAKMKQIQTDEFARDSALQAEEDKRGYIKQTEAQENDILSKQLGVDTTIMGSAFGQSNYNMSQAAQIAATRASIVPGIVGGLAGGFMNLAGAYAMRPRVSTTGSSGGSSIIGWTGNN